MENEDKKEVVEPEVLDTKKEESDEKIRQLFNDYQMKVDDEEVEKTQTITEPNRPAHWSQRIAAGIIDLCILFLAYLGLYQLFMYTGMGDALRAENQAIREVNDYYKLQPLLADSDETMGYKLYEGDPNYEDEKYQNYYVYDADETGKKYKVVDYTGVTDELKKAYQEALSKNDKRNTAISNGNLIVFGMNCLAGGISETIFLLVIPLLNKNRASIGKLAAGLQVINSKYQTEARWYQMTGRYLWTLSIESVLMLFFLPTIGSLSNVWVTMMVVPLLLFIITLLNKDRRTLHDFVARTRVIDKRTFVPLSEQ